MNRRCVNLHSWKLLDFSRIRTSISLQMHFRALVSCGASTPKSVSFKVNRIEAFLILKLVEVERAQ
jgi:hypothetical protein